MSVPLRPSSRSRRYARPGVSTAGSSAVLGVVAAVLGAGAYSSFLLAAWLVPPSGRTEAFVSELEAPGSPHSGFFRLTDVVAGVAIVVVAAVLHRRFSRLTRIGPAVVALAVVGLSSVVDGTTSMSCLPTVDSTCAADEHRPLGLIGQLGTLHTDSGVIGFLAAGLAAALAGSALGAAAPAWSRFSVTVAITLGGCGLLEVAVLLAGGDVALVERGRIVLTSVWLLTLCLPMTDGRRNALGRRLSRG